MTATSTSAIAREVITEMCRRGQTLAVAESLTGGLLCATLTEVPGASECIRGGVVSYATDLKASLLGVDVDLLARVGPVSEEVARQMAIGAAVACGADFGASTTGVAGPTEQDGVAIGTVFIAVASQDGATECVQRLALHGDRTEIRAQSVHAALMLVRSLSPRARPR